MEYTQWGVNVVPQENYSLNPCCNGIYSMSVWMYGIMCYVKVLILVVMEYTQWGF